MEIKYDSIDGLDSASAKEYVMGLLSALKLTEKEINNLRAEKAKWDRRVSLAQEHGKDDLCREALNERDRINVRITNLEAEAAELKASVKKTQSQLHLLPAKERSVDPDLLEQELLILSGRMPGDEKEAEQDRTFAKLEKESAADAALEALKTRMGK